MAFQSSQIDIELEYNLNNTPANFSLIDNTDYSAETYSNILGLLRAVGPSGSQFYNNVNYASPDIDIDNSTSSADLGSLPQVGGKVTNGLYNFTYTIKIEDMLQSHTVVSNNIAAKTFTVVGNIASLILDATAAGWEIIDNTTESLTIVSATYSNQTGLTTVTIDETLTNLTSLAQFQFTVDRIFSKQFQQDYSYVSPETCIYVDIDDCCSSVTLTDNTAYLTGATITRLHTVSYPKGMVTPIADIESPLQTLTISPIWTGTWTDVFTSEISGTNGIITIQDEIRFVKDFKVTSSRGLCEVYSCITNMATKYASYLTTAPQKAIEMGKYINQASAAYMAYNIGKKCGEAGYEVYLELIKTVADSCGCGCSDCGPCDDNTPVQVVGCCDNVGTSGNTIVITSTGGTITITATTVGDTTTFEIDVVDAHITGLAEQAIAAASISDLDDVDTTNISAANAQCLIWNQGLGVWQRGVPQLELVALTDVDDTGLANDMVLYYDNATTSFKFKTIGSTSLEDLTDVTITSIQSGQIIKWNGTAWVNANNTLALLSDVSISGISNNQIIRWISANNRFERYTLIQTISGMNDITPAITITTGAKLIHNGSTWTPSYIENFDSFTSAAFSSISGFDYTVSGQRGFTLRFDPVTNKVSLRGVIEPSVITGAATTFTVLTTTYRPTDFTTFTCIGGLGVQSFTCAGYVTVGGEVVIAYHYDDNGDLQFGPPAGGVSFDGVEWFLD
jgi:hypothetical protein